MSCTAVAVSSASRFSPEVAKELSNDTSQKNKTKTGIQDLPMKFIRQLLDCLGKSESTMRVTCTFFKDCYPFHAHLRIKPFEDMPSDIFGRVIKAYIRSGCVIHSIDAREMECTDADLVKLMGSPIKKLGIRGSAVTEVGMIAIAKLPIKKLYFWNMKDPAENLNYLAKMQITHLQLITAKISDKEVVHLKDMPLKHLYFGGRFIIISKAGMENLRQVPPGNFKHQAGVI